MNGGVSLSHCRWSLKDRCSLFRHEHAPFLILEWRRKILFFLIGIQSNVMRNGYCLETEAQGKLRECLIKTMVFLDLLCYYS